MRSDDRRAWFRASTRTWTIIIAAIAWGVTEFLPLLNHGVKPVPEIGPAFLAFLGACVALPEVNRIRREARKDNDEDPPAPKRQ